MVKIGQHTKNLIVDKRFQVVPAMSCVEAAPVVTNSHVFHAASTPHLYAFAAGLFAALSVKEPKKQYMYSDSLIKYLVSS